MSDRRPSTYVATTTRGGIRVTVEVELADSVGGDVDELGEHTGMAAIRLLRQAEKLNQTAPF